MSFFGELHPYRKDTLQAEVYEKVGAVQKAKELYERVSQAHNAYPKYMKRRNYNKELKNSCELALIRLEDEAQDSHFHQEGYK